MPSERTRRGRRGAVAGAVAAGVWAAQQPLDRRVFGVDYDDCELLGTIVTRGRYAYPLGLLGHLVNGAVFGAVYAQVAPSLPGPAPVRGVAAATAEHLASWPSLSLLHLHPAADRFPRLWGDRAAFAQATWRHVLFGAVLGGIEGRLNPAPGEAPAPPGEPETTTNGHGDSQRVAVVTRG